MDNKARAWHQAHPMPKNATPDQRIAWHLAHAKHCACREIPAGILQLMKARKISPDSKPHTSGPKR